MHPNVSDWLLSAECRTLDITALTEALASRLPVSRISCGLRTMHPEIQIVSVWWTSSEGTQSEDLHFGGSIQEDFVKGPIPRLQASGATHLRVPLRTTEDLEPLLARLKAAGATDYLILRLPGAIEQVISFATEDPNGFSDDELDKLISLRLALSIRLELAQQQHITHSLLRAYLGRNAAEHVLAGHFRRTHGQELDVLVFTCDLRGFTRRVDERPLAEVLDDLDHYFECVSEPWIQAGGEVIKFVGDAVLGILPLGDSPNTNALQGLEAAKKAFANLEEASKALPEGRSTLEMGWVLHAGRVAYGNIGSRSRVDFTVIGPAVNEASRLEKLTKTLAPLILTAPVAALLEGVQLRSLGSHPLRGVSHAIELYGLPE